MVNLDPHHKSKNQQKKSNFHIIEMHHANWIESKYQSNLEKWIIEDGSYNHLYHIVNFKY
jgi:hypothetical protein